MDYTKEELMAENRRRREALEEQSRAVSYPKGKISLERCRRDFMYWAARAVKIRDKTTGRTVPFVLNRAQKRVLGELEKMRTAGQPIRIIMLKARQWGGSTLIQVYMAWIQLVHRENWHSLICAHVKDSARNIRGMYSTLLEHYPEELLPTDKACGFVPFEGAQNIRKIPGRECRIAVASSECQDSARGSDLSMAHLSEVAYWKATAQRDPEDFLRSVCGTVPIEPLTLVAIESTANGVGNFFHNEWLRAVAGKSDKLPVFVPWYEIDIYSLELADPWTFWESLDAYELGLWKDHCCTLEQIHWYRKKSSEYPKAELMHAEFPTTADEAFVTSDSNVFANERVESLRRGCLPPERGEMGSGDAFVKDNRGNLSLWKRPEAGTAYIVTVDVGGRSDKADWSVIAVMKASERPETVAQWRGHTDHDLLADKAMAIGRYYNEALLVIESNSLETADESSVSSSVLSRVARDYRNVYRRQRRQPVGGGGPAVGFHTNVHTKALAINALITAVREGSYIERDNEACNELATYCRRPNGSYGARRGCHDDILMTRAISLYVLDECRHYICNGQTKLPPHTSGW